MWPGALSQTPLAARRGQLGFLVQFGLGGEALGGWVAFVFCPHVAPWRPYHRAAAAYLGGLLAAEARSLLLADHADVVCGV